MVSNGFPGLRDPSDTVSNGIPGPRDPSDMVSDGIPGLRDLSDMVPGSGVVLGQRCGGMSGARAANRRLPRRRSMRKTASLEVRDGDPAER